MSTLSIRIPDSKYERLKNLAASKKISVNKLFDELTTQALTEHDIQAQFEMRAAKGNSIRGLETLLKLDNLDL